MHPSRRLHAYTYGEYLLLEADAPTVRHEFVDGDIFAMAGGSDHYSAVISAVSGELYTQLRGAPCGLRDSNMRIRVRATGNAFYADAIIVCGQAEVVHELAGGDSLLNPTVVIEVLSPSTEAYDRGAKFEENYSLIPSLRDYVLVAQPEAVIEVRSRDDAGNWTVRTYREGEAAEISSASCRLDVDTVYREARKNAR